MPLSSLPGKVLRKVRWLTNDIFFALGWRQAERLLQGPGQCILCYHGLCRPGQPLLNGRFITADRFEDQVRFLKKHAQVVSVDDYFAGRYDASRFALAITFDDGYHNNLQYALPVLERHAVPATFFLTSSAGRGAEWLWTDFLDVATHLGPDTITIDSRKFYRKRWRHTRYYTDAAGRKLARWARHSSWAFIQAMETAFLEAGVWQNADTLAEFWQLLTPAEIRELAASPHVTIGAHGHTHQDLTVLPHSEACQEILTCKQTLEQITGQAIHALAYPFGAFSPALAAFAEKAGFSQQLTLEFLYPGDRQDHRLRERLTVNPFISDNNQLLAIRNGSY